VVARLIVRYDAAVTARNRKGIAVSVTARYPKALYIAKGIDDWQYRTPTLSLLNPKNRGDAVMIERPLR
jgi:hypothetical protein